MKEFKITRFDPIAQKPFVEYEFFTSEDAANEWADLVNASDALHQVTGVELFEDHDHNELKYEY